MPRFVVCACPLAGRVRPVSPLVRVVVAGGRDMCCYAGSTDRSRVGSVAARVAGPNPKADNGGNLERTFSGRAWRDGLAVVRWDVSTGLLQPGPGRLADLDELDEPVDVIGGSTTGHVRAGVRRAIPDRVCRSKVAAPGAVPASCDGPPTAPDLVVGRGESGDAAAGQAIDAVPGRANV
jgi:hypothetical protein